MGIENVTTEEFTENFGAPGETMPIGLESEYITEDNQYFRTIDDNDSNENNNKETNDEFVDIDDTSYESDDTNTEDIDFDT